MLVFCEGQLKPGGQREQPGRQKKRPHQALLVPGNHFLPGAYFEAGPIEQEDGELNSLEVTAPAAIDRLWITTTVSMKYDVKVRGVIKWFSFYRHIL